MGVACTPQGSAPAGTAPAGTVGNAPAGSAPPSPSDPTATPRERPPAARLDRLPADVLARVKDRFGARCTAMHACGDLWGIDCDAAVDGPYYYVRAQTLEVVAKCGGYCMGGRCTNCPPKEWTCATY